MNGNDEKFVCTKCGHSDTWNMADVNAASEDDPNPVLSCPKCGGYLEDVEYDEEV